MASLASNPPQSKEDDPSTNMLMFTRARVTSFPRKESAHLGSPLSEPRTLLSPDRLPHLRDLKLARCWDAVTVWTGRLRDQKVIVHQYHSLENSDWNVDERRSFSKDDVDRHLTLLRPIHHFNINPILGTMCVHGSQISFVSPRLKHDDATGFLNKQSPANMGPALVRVGIDIASALQYLHSHGPQIVHGAVYAHNIVVNETHNAQILLAAIRPSGVDSEAAIARSEYRFAAPEILAAIRSGHPVKLSAASDCYAFAMTILELATGSLPYASEFKNEYSAIQEVENGLNPTRPEKFAHMEQAAASDVLWALLTDMWKYDPMKRPSLDEVCGRLKHVLSLTIVT